MYRIHPTEKEIALCESCIFAFIRCQDCHLCDLGKISKAIVANKKRRKK